MYYPAAFSPASRATLEELFPDAILANDDDASVLGLNVVSDGRHVVLPAGATHLADELERHGDEPIPVDTSELLKAGGAVKCCTLELPALARPREPSVRGTDLAHPQGTGPPSFWRCLLPSLSP